MDFRGLSQIKSDPSPQDKTWTIPNILSMGRVAATPLLCYEIMQQDYMLALGIFTASAITDLVDGWWARKFNQQSVLGSFLDPLADKLMISGTTLFLGVSGVFSYPLVFIILLRDSLLVTGAGLSRFYTLPTHLRSLQHYFSLNHIPSVEVKPSTVSKANTVLQVGLVALGILTPAFHLPVVYMHQLGALTMTTTIWSGLDYLFSIPKTMQSLAKNQPRS